MKKEFIFEFGADASLDGLDKMIVCLPTVETCDGSSVFNKRCKITMEIIE